MHWIEAGILFLILLAMIVLLLVLLHRTRLGSLLHEHIADRPRRRLFSRVGQLLSDVCHCAGMGFFASGTRFRLFTTSS